MPVAHQDCQRVPLTIPASLLGGIDEPLDLGWRQVLTLATIFGVRPAAYPMPVNGNCS
jgi:hypothetical protein